MEKTIHSEAYKIVRQWLTEMRHKKKLTQRQFAKILNIQHSWVGKVELGERRIDIVEYVRLCKAMDVDPHIGLDLCIKQIEAE